MLVVRGRRDDARAVAAFVPDCVVFGKRLLTDTRIPRRVTVAVALVVAYLVSPLDLVPDFIPVVGQLDDAVVVLVAMRFVSRSVDRRLLEELWPGSGSGLRAVLTLSRRDRGTSPKS